MPVPSSIVNEEFQAQVAARKSDGSTDEAFNGSITVSLVPHEGGGVLSGTLTQAAVDGISTFPDLSINVVGEDYQLLADAPGFASVDSNLFDVISGGGGLPEYFLVIPGGADVSVYAAAVSDGIPVGIAIHLIISVTGDVEKLIMGSSWVPGSQFTLNIEDEILISGASGRGGSFVDDPFPGKDAGDGEDGGDAIELSGNTVSINNLGNIFGGGGGGGASSAPTSNITGVDSAITALSYPAGGGAGRGHGAGDGGTGGAVTLAHAQIIASLPTPPFFYNVIDSMTPVSVPAGDAQITQLSTDGADGDKLAFGAGGIPAIIVGDVNTNSGSGGDGGDWGEDGLDGGASTASPATTDFPPGIGGTAGKAVSLSGGAVIWLAGNNPTQVKGAVA